VGSTDRIGGRTRIASTAKIVPVRRFLALLAVASLSCGDLDLDNDGWLDYADCDDLNPALNPGADDIPGDGIDQDCSGVDTALCWFDGDGDRFGFPGPDYDNPVPGTPDADGSCLEEGQSPNPLDCNDAAAWVRPGAEDAAGDGIDADCSGADAVFCWTDGDGDGYGSGDALQVNPEDCDEDAGFARAGGDCDDTDPEIGPQARDVPDDGIDQDCNGSDTLVCYFDGDEDGWGSTARYDETTDGSCLNSRRQTDNPDDCDDSLAWIHPGAEDVPDDGIDADCTDADTVTCYEDLDGDGFGNPTVIIDEPDCSREGLSSSAEDCDDTDPTVFPVASDTPEDGIDQNCDGVDGAMCFFDGDQDGFGYGSQPLSYDPDGDCTDDDFQTDIGWDCDDSVADIHPGAVEIPDDGLDQDCNGADTVTCFTDGDGDLFGGPTTHLDNDGECTDAGQAASGSDCDDASASVFPGAVETVDDGIDQDCNGTDTVSCFYDGDGDGFGYTGSPTTTDPDGDCTDDPFQTDVGGDCDDTDPNVLGGCP